MEIFLKLSFCFKILPFVVFFIGIQKWKINLPPNYIMPQTDEAEQGKIFKNFCRGIQMIDTIFTSKMTSFGIVRPNFITFVPF